MDCNELYFYIDSTYTFSLASTHAGTHAGTHTHMLFINRHVGYPAHRNNSRVNSPMSRRIFSARSKRNQAEKQFFFYQ